MNDKPKTLLIDRHELRRIYFNASDATLWRLQKQGILVPIRLGRKVRYRRADVERLVNGEFDAHMSSEG